jgi:hypothetical protein
VILGFEPDAAYDICDQNVFLDLISVRRFF